MISRDQGDGWEDVPVQIYKDEPGTWVGVKRHSFAADASTDFEMRCFEIAPNGFTSLERHQHEHCVMVIKGQGEVFLKGKWAKLQAHDVVHVASWEPHQFKNTGDTGDTAFSILCVVNRDRDRPELLDSEDAPGHKS